jgi:tetratricopeptide (TPR) repeat protein
VSLGNRVAEVKFYYDWNWEWARREYERALELNANNSHAMARYSLFLSALGRHDEAFEKATAAARLDPYTPTVRFAPGMALFYARRYDEAITKFLALANVHPFALGAPDRYALGRAYLATGNSRDAIEQIESAMNQMGRLAPMLAELARAHVHAGNKPEARRLLKELTAIGGTSPANLAYVYAALGNTDRAFEELNRAADQRAAALLWASVDPRLDGLRPDPRFRELLARIGLSE